MKKGQILGVIILLLIFGGAFIVKTFILEPTDESTVIHGIIDSEKTTFFEDQDVKNILLKKYNISLKLKGAGPIEIATSKTKDIDFLWPSNVEVLEIFKKLNKNRIIKSEIIFHSPVVLYSWNSIVKELKKTGFITEESNTLFFSKFNKLLEMILKGKEWKDLGIKELYGKVSIHTSDPYKSSSSLMFAGLTANMLNEGDIVNDLSLNYTIPKIKDLYRHISQYEESSTRLFNNYLQTGPGIKPIIVGYENQIIQFSQVNKKEWKNIKDKIAIIYPVPTVWSSHPLIILNEKAEILIKAMRDDKIRKIAWNRHGYRIGLLSSQYNKATLSVKGIPERVTKVIQMPKAGIIYHIAKYHTSKNSRGHNSSPVKVNDGKRKNIGQGNSKKDTPEKTSTDPGEDTYKVF